MYQGALSAGTLPTRLSSSQDHRSSATFAQLSSRPKLWRGLRELPHHTNIHRERKPACLLLRGILKIKGKKEEVRGKGESAHGQNVGDVPDFVAPPCYPPST